MALLTAIHEIVTPEGNIEPGVTFDADKVYGDAAKDAVADLARLGAVREPSPEEAAFYEVTNRSRNTPKADAKPAAAKPAAAASGKGDDFS